MITIILIHRPQVASPFGHGRPTIENPPDRLLGRNFSGKNLLTGGGETETQRWWALGSLEKEKESRFTGVLTAKYVCAERDVL